MTTLQQIQDEYAKQQGYKSWWLLNVYCKDMSEHYENIIQIVQDELKESIAEELIWMENPELLKEIFNTENIK